MIDLVKQSPIANVKMKCDLTMDGQLSIDRGPSCRREQYRANTAARLRMLNEDDRGKHHGHDRDDVDVPKRYLRDVPNPYEVGQREVLNYTAVVELCAKAAKVRSTGVL